MTAAAGMAGVAASGMVAATADAVRPNIVTGAVRTTVAGASATGAKAGTRAEAAVARAVRERGARAATVERRGQ